MLLRKRWYFEKDIIHMTFIMMYCSTLLLVTNFILCLIYFYLYVQGVSLCVGSCAHVRACRGQNSTSGICLWALSTDFFWEQVSHWNLELINRLGWPVTDPRDMPLCLPSAGIKTCHHSWLLLCVFWGCNSSPVCHANTLPTEPRPIHLIYKLNFIIHMYASPKGSTPRAEHCVGGFDPFGGTRHPAPR